MLGIICLSPSCDITYSGLMRVDESQVYDDYYALVDHDLLVYGVIVVSITSSRQFICRFHKLLVTDNDMMATNSSCS
jgi:hypothetical protein